VFFHLFRENTVAKFAGVPSEAVRRQITRFFC